MGDNGPGFGSNFPLLAAGDLSAKVIIAAGAADEGIEAGETFAEDRFVRD